MRSIRLLVCLGFVALGCNGSKDGLGSGGEDLAVAPPDLAMPSSPDLAMPATPLSCSGVLTCLSSTKMASCFTRATPKAAMLLTALIDCGKLACGDYDGGPGSCAGVQDQSQACLMCAAQDIQSGDCMSQLQACLADK